jgi:hypothetical protein
MSASTRCFLKRDDAHIQIIFNLLELILHIGKAFSCHDVAVWRT